MPPPPEQVIPGVWWLHGTRGSNVYLVRTAAGDVALVDTGFADSAPAIFDALDALGLPLRAILLTHRHRDHTGAAAVVAAATGAPVIAGAGDCRVRHGQLVLRSGVGRSHPVRLAVAFLRRRPAPVPVAIAIAIAEQQEVAPGILAVPTPGHTPGSLCFVALHQRAAFVGDLVISHGGELTRSLRWANHDDRQYLQSIASFSAVGPPAGFPGHGPPMLSDFDVALRQLAALPRRPLTPRTAVERAIRLARFTAGFATRRRPQSSR